jgi:hypothetical protein
VFENVFFARKSIKIIFFISVFKFIFDISISKQFKNTNKINLMKKKINFNIKNKLKLTFKSNHVLDLKIYYV